MTRREYMKYHQEMKDCKGNTIIPGDTVVINNHYGSTPHIGVADHFTENGNVAVSYDWIDWRGKIIKVWAYRKSGTIIKLRSAGGRNNEIQSYTVPSQESLYQREFGG